jgi:hypothetical protein
MVSRTSGRAHRQQRVPPQLPDRRIRAEITLKLTVTLEGEPYERTDAYNAIVAALEPALQEIAARYLRDERGESVTLKREGDEVVQELPLFSQRPKLTLVTQSASSGHRTRKKRLVTLS